MKDNKLDEIQKQLENDISNEEEQDNYIEELSEEIASRLLAQSKNVNYEILEKQYNFRYIVLNDEINLIITDLRLFDLVQTRYKPCIAKMRIDNNFTMLENLHAVVSGYLRNLTGRILPEDISYEDDIDNDEE